jgi:hypothetical protein
LVSFIEEFYSFLQVARANAEQYLIKLFRLGTGLISDAQRASAEVNSEKLTELNDGCSLVFTKAGWFTGAASVTSEARARLCGLKVFLSQGKKPVARQPLAVISLVCIAQLFAKLVDTDDTPARGLNRAILQFLGSRRFSGAP